MLLVEYDPESQWISVATTFAAQFFQDNRHVGYLAMIRPPEDIREGLSALGVNVAEAERSGRLAVEDWYSATLSGGQLEHGSQAGLFEKGESGLRIRSLKVADLSVEWLKTTKHGPKPYDIVDYWPSGSLVIAESVSSILRFNDEKTFVELMESRVSPDERKRKHVTIHGLVRGVHSGWLYKRMESFSDGVVDIRVMERGDEAKNLLRIRSLKGQRHDSRWHEIDVGPNGEATVVT